MIVSESKNANYCTEISNETSIVFSDVTEEKGGQGQYFRPHDLLCAGLSACLNIGARMLMDHHNIKYDKVIVKVDLDRTDANKTKFQYNIDIVGELSKETKRWVIEKASNCAVRKTLSKELTFKLIP
ncbi:OsmC family peroxiredoxin [Heliobacterium undosum]|uniref:OsmC family peroxiredoxin n=1 Tax=Heliomicrobium undosum TaxID=121734 RepID=A0A845L1H8_9FIRM|nr:OsmC family protein [Heliomicrobium undosum]MZP28644.1 OsmC family peroxiredoxin [Heliomicrobium undosum]